MVVRGKGKIKMSLISLWQYIFSRFDTDYNPNPNPNPNPDPDPNPNPNPDPDPDPDPSKYKSIYENIPCVCFHLL